MDLLQRAQKEENRWSLFDNKEKYETAADLYEQAGNLFKMEAKHEESASAYVKAGELYDRIKRSYYSTKVYIEAAKQFKYFDSKTALVYLIKVKEYYELTGDFTKGAGILEEIAVEDPDNAIMWYVKAVEYYIGENNIVRANKSRLKLCDIYLKDKNYELAGRLYETIANSCDSKISWTKIDYYMNAIICWLALDNYDLAYNKLVYYYTENDPKIRTHYKYKHLRELVQACVDGHFQKFIDATYELDQKQALPSWAVIALLEVRNNLQNISDGIL